MPTNEPEPESDPLPENTVFFALPDGRMIDMLSFMEHQRGREASMDVKSLQEGDLVAFQYEDDEDEDSDEGVENSQKGFTYEVQRAEWTNLGAGLQPSVSLWGVLHGPHLPAEVVGQPARFVGSGIGGSSIRAGYIATGQAPAFYFPDKGEYPAPFINNFEVFRPDEDGLHPIGPNELDAETRRSLPEHERRLEQVDKLAKLFGFGEYRDFSERARKGKRQKYEDERYAAEHKCDAGGSILAVYDKQTRQWYGFSYLGAHNEDILQVSHADLSGHGRREVFDPIDLNLEWFTATNNVYNSGEAITTYITSNRYGLSAIHYHPSYEEILGLMKVPRDHEGDTSRLPKPNFVKIDGGRTMVERRWYMDDWEADHPGSYDRLENDVSIESREEGGAVITAEEVGGMKELKDVDAELDAIIAHMEDSETVDYPVTWHATRKRKVAKAVGRVMNRRNKS